MVHGYGRDCAELLGLVAAKRARATAQTGTDLLDLIEETESHMPTEQPTYRTGAHWGTTIVRKGTGPVDDMGHRSGDELVAVVTNGDDRLAELICQRLNVNNRAEDWGACCDSRAAQLGQLIAERHAGADEVAAKIVAGLREWGQIDAARLAQQIAERAPETPPVGDAPPL